MKAFVLHRRPYRETSLLVDFFTAESGVQRAVAKGARRMQRGSHATSGLLQPFKPLWINLRGESGLRQLLQVESSACQIELTGESWLSGHYVNELILRLVPQGEHHSGLFEDYQICLERLATLEPAEWTLRCFEKRLFQHLGYALPLEREIKQNQPILPDRWYRFEIERGFIEVSSSVVHAATSGKGIYCRGASLLSLAREELSDPQLLPDLKRLSRLFLQRLLGDKPLRTAIFAQDLKNHSRFQDGI